MAHIDKFDPAFGTYVRVETGPILEHLKKMDDEAQSISITNSFRAICAELVELAERVANLEVMAWMDSDE